MEGVRSYYQSNFDVDEEGNLVVHANEKSNRPYDLIIPEYFSGITVEYLLTLDTFSYQYLEYCIIADLRKREHKRQMKKEKGN